MRRARRSPRSSDRWSTFGNGSFTAPDASADARGVVLATLLAWPLLLCGAYSQLNTPFHAMEAWGPRSTWKRIARKAIRRGAPSTDVFVSTPPPNLDVRQPVTSWRGRACVFLCCAFPTA